MGFYRPATVSDFEDFEVEYSNYSNMEDWTKKLIEQGDISKAMKSIRDSNGMGLMECQRFCLLYQAYVSAKNDFEQGKPVFVAY